MMKLFRKSEEVIGAVVDTVDHAITTDHPLPAIPDTTGEYPASLGDFNLVLLVKEHGTIRQQKLTQKRNELLAELKKIDKELLEIEVLLKAVNGM